jgi:hypothetical protein
VEIKCHAFFTSVLYLAEDGHEDVKTVNVSVVTSGCSSIWLCLMRTLNI